MTIGGHADAPFCKGFDLGLVAVDRGLVDLQPMARAGLHVGDLIVPLSDCVHKEKR